MFDPMLKLENPLRKFIYRLMKNRENEIEFIVLFGSRAKGEWCKGSDYDVLIGLKIDDKKRFIDRIYEFSLLSDGEVEPFPYSCSEWRSMFKEFNTLLLEALEHGIIIFDRGSFAEMKKTFLKWREKGIVTPTSFGWRIKNA
ncbi:nucleotidyltransferase domain-containing protein [Candidatus Bathyarchaeota archaeon]|nr:nucleotidyltransferase domain-containing protein [Candidatus Bathyarchaeota archaeon]